MIATTVEQSRHLAELGIPKESADMIWKYYRDEDGKVKYYDLANVSFGYYSGIAIPAWSLSALLEFMPPCLKGDNNESYFFALEKDSYDDGKIVYDACYANWDGLIKMSYLKGNNPIEAAYKMVVWLKENNKI